MSWTGMLALAAAQATPLERDLLQVADLSWRPVHDTVMGGRSSGTVEPGEDGVRFEGTLSLKNNGGFASIRGESDGFDLKRTLEMDPEVRRRASLCYHQIQPPRLARRSVCGAAV